MKTIALRALRGKVELEGLGLDEARDIFGEAEETYGVVVVETSASRARSMLRDAGYRTKAAS